MKLKVRFSRALVFDFFANHCFWLIILGYLLSLFYFSIPIVAVLSLIILICFASGISIRRLKPNIVYFYFAYAFITGAMYSANGLPKNLMYTGYAYSLIPMLMYFIPKYDIEKFYKKAFDAIFFSIVIAIILYVLQPAFYAQYLYDRGFTGGSLVAWIRPSLIQGLYGITTMGSFCACGFIFYWWKLSEKEKFSGIKCLVCFVVLLYCRRRAAVVSAFVVFMVENFIFYKRGKASGRRTLILTACSCVLVVLVFVFHNQASLLLNRFTNISSAMNERSSNWTDVVATLGVYSLFGKGIGSSNHAAVAAGFEGAVDGQYAMIICEFGYIGLVLFTISVTKGMMLYLKNKREEYTCIPMMIVLLFLLQGVGSNILEFPVLGVLFWYSLSALEGNKNDKRLWNYNSSGELLV